MKKFLLSLIILVSFISFGNAVVFNQGVDKNPIYQRITITQVVSSINVQVGTTNQTTVTPTAPGFWFIQADGPVFIDFGSGRGVSLNANVPYDFGAQYLYVSTAKIQATTASQNVRGFVYDYKY